MRIKLFLLCVMTMAVFSVFAAPIVVSAPKKVRKTKGKRPPTVKMVFVKGGTFLMGGTGKDSREDELPVHQVTLSDFYIGKYEVTSRQWRDVMGVNHRGCFGSGNKKLPEESVDWGEVQEFIAKLNALTGKNYRLPTEAEWEFAARGGNKSKGYTYSGSNDANKVAWYYDNNRTDNNRSGKTNVIGTKAPNELGIYDMSGNVAEWCSDYYGDYPSEAQTNPTGPSSGSYRVFRGGEWHHDARFCRSTCRYHNSPGFIHDALGFRLVLPAKN
jgi:formylglycine-generating enzyme required for sulfatase activity